jgi:hypothetical protein
VSAIFNRAVVRGFHEQLAIAAVGQVVVVAQQEAQRAFAGQGGDIGDGFVAAQEGLDAREFACRAPVVATYAPPAPSTASPVTQSSA